MSQLIELTYVSEPAQNMSFLGLMRLLYHSYSNNQALGITGALIYENNKFGQVIEGLEKDINALWQKIQKDDRHKNVHLIESKQISERSFSKWTMVFQGSEEMAETLPEVSAAIEDVEFPKDHPLLIALRDSQ
ncbi:BLUF domain-containing protein [Polynucleobacter sp. MWH-Berg-3C6]|uniref:BLUF domain-containing protein n=1 Tax=Polynucleobacter sp. MWH-Berg-3C6 TaxID=1855882 RepID=UPI001C0AFBAE|nr:BLUF domain-containing protein [Polynucleobacter sp. MWH-Berg-3C6]MBU3550828.1 BLUF domain-containing protein [Polynucleobacter sp. MWH-Berg-3C6]